MSIIGKISCTMLAFVGMIACAAGERDLSTKRSDGETPAAVETPPSPNPEPPKDDLAVDVPVPLGAFESLGLGFAKQLPLSVTINPADESVLLKSGILNASLYPGAEIVPALARMHDVLTKCAAQANAANPTAPAKKGVGNVYPIKAETPEFPTIGVTYLDHAQPARRYGFDLYRPAPDGSLLRMARVLFREATEQEGGGTLFWITYAEPAPTASKTALPTRYIDLAYSTALREVTGTVVNTAPLAGEGTRTAYALKLAFDASYISQASYVKDGDGFRLEIRRGRFDILFTSVGQDAVLPGDKVAEYGNDMKRIFAEHPESRYLFGQITRTVRGLGVCGTLGTQIGLAPDICATNTVLTDDAVQDAIMATCPTLDESTLVAQALGCPGFRLIKYYKAPFVYSTLENGVFKLGEANSTHQALQAGFATMPDAPSFAGLTAPTTEKPLLRPAADLAGSTATLDVP